MTTKTEQAHNAGKHETNPSRRCKLCWEVARAAQAKVFAVSEADKERMAKIKAKGGPLWEIISAMEWIRTGVDPKAVRGAWRGMAQRCEDVA